jgi:hypothetical protein
MKQVSDFCTIFGVEKKIFEIFGLGRKKALISLLFTILGILSISYANEYAIFEENHKKGLKNNRGKILIPPEYDDLGWSDGTTSVVNGVIGYNLGESWGIIHVNNTRITPPGFTSLIPFLKDLIIASKLDSYKLNDLFGLIHPSGKVAVNFKYNTLKKFGNNLIVTKKDQNQIFFGLINHKDELLIPFEYISGRMITPGILALRDQKQMLHLINSSGKPFFDKKIDEVEVFADKFLMISIHGNKGLIDLSGNAITPIRYEQFNVNNNGIVNGMSARTWDVLTLHGDLVKTLKYNHVIPIDTGFYKAKRLNFSFIIDENAHEIFRIKNSGIEFLNDSLALFNTRNRYGVINYTGDTIIQPIYDSIKISQNRFFLYSRKANQRGWKIADLFGVLLSNQEYDAIYRLDEFDLAYKKNGFWGIVDKYGTEKIFAKYDSIFTKMNDLYLVDFYGEKGVIDDSDAWRIYPQKGEVYLLQNGNYLISSYFQSRVISRWGIDLYTSENYLWPVGGVFIEEDFEDNFGLIDKNYRQVLAAEHAFVAPIVKDSVFLFKNEKGWGVVDNSGRIFFKDDNSIEQIIGYHDEFIGVKIEGFYGFIDLNGKLRIANRYEGISLFNNGIANIKILNKWGCINTAENIVVQPYFDQIGFFENGLAIAQRNNKYGILNNSGKTVIEFDYDSLFRIQNGNFIGRLNGKYGLINNKGETMFYPKYDAISDLNNGFVIARRNNKSGVFTSSGVFIIPVKYDHILFDPYNQVFLVSVNPTWEAILNLQNSRLF